MKRYAPAVLIALLMAGCSEPVVSDATGGEKGASNAGGRNAGGATGKGAEIGGGRPLWPDGGAMTERPPDPGFGEKNCGLQTFKLEQRPAELMLVLDRSGSMNQPAGALSMTSKWDDTTSALNETMMKTDALIHWGLKTFPSSDSRCSVADGVDVPSAPMNYATVWGKIMASAPAGGGGTPTTLAIQKAVAQLKTSTSPNPRYLVLATDGEPNCGMGGGLFGLPGNDANDAVMAITDAQNAGYKTFVIGIATGRNADSVLTRMAMAGGEPRMGTPPYYPVSNRGDLINALGVITGLVTDCVFRLNKAPPSPPDVAVNVGASRIQRDPSHMNGWDYGAALETVQFYGAACEQVKQSLGKNVQIIYGCPGVVIK